MKANTFFNIMKKLLCTASLLLAFSMSSFANTNDSKLTAISKESKLITVIEEAPPCITITIKIVVVTGEPGADSIDDGIIITYKNITISNCL